jgi:site-specific DNA-methyltransferase (adenine-specific)
MDLMAEMPDDCVDLAICDPEYGINVNKMNLGEGGGLYRQPKTYKRGSWDNKPPDKEYFDELFRVSKNQIIWGGNYFISKILKDSSCWIFWNKNNGGSDFADGELAWTSFNKPVRIFKYTWSGFIQENMGRNKEVRIHPTQKPVALYRWLLQNYAKEGDLIFDSHSGSGSCAVACVEERFNYIACELDPDYHKASLERLQPYLDQGRLF